MWQMGAMLVAWVVVLSLVPLFMLALAAVRWAQGL